MLNETPSTRDPVLNTDGHAFITAATGVEGSQLIPPSLYLLTLIVPFLPVHDALRRRRVRS